MHELYDKHHKVSPNLNSYQKKKQKQKTILTNMKSYENDKKVCLIQSTQIQG